MIYELHIKGHHFRIRYEDIAMVDTGVWAYISNTKRIFYPYSIIECIIEEEESNRSMKEEHIRYGEARLLPTENVKPFVNRIYNDIITLIKKYCDEECTLQDLLDDLNEKNV